jgi:hypothetical protein
MIRKSSKKNPQDHASAWNDRFLKILKRDYRNLDAAVASILRNARVAQICAMLIRAYIDKGVTDWLYKDRKIRGDKYKKRLDAAIAGINEAISLYGIADDREKPSISAGWPSSLPNGGNAAKKRLEQNATAATVRILSSMNASASWNHNWDSAQRMQLLPICLMRALKPTETCRRTR